MKTYNHHRYLHKIFQQILILETSLMPGEVGSELSESDTFVSDEDEEDETESE